MPGSWHRAARGGPDKPGHDEFEPGHDECVPGHDDFEAGMTDKTWHHR
jgi:hypothetical protein